MDAMEMFRDMILKDTKKSANGRKIKKGDQEITITITSGPKMMGEMDDMGDMGECEDGQDCATGGSELKKRLARLRG